MQSLKTIILQIKCPVKPITKQENENKQRQREKQ